MKAFFSAMFFFGSMAVGNAQGNSFGLIKFRIPESWTEQTKMHYVTYYGKEPETNTWMEIRVHEPESAAAKPDSSFRMAWKNYISTLAGIGAPAFKKGYTESGLPIVYNVAFPAPLKEDNVTQYRQLLTVIIDKQMQAIEMIAASEKDLKQLRNFIETFAEGIDTIAKKKG